MRNGTQLQTPLRLVFTTRAVAGTTQHTTACNTMVNGSVKDTHKQAVVLC